METVYIELEKPPKGVNHARSVQGLAASKHWNKLKEFAEAIDVKPFNDFMEKGRGPKQWHRPEEALLTLQRLINYIAANMRCVDNARLLIRDLNSYQNILTAAQARNSRFRFSTTQPADYNA